MLYWKFKLTSNEFKKKKGVRGQNNRNEGQMEEKKQEYKKGRKVREDGKQEGVKEGQKDGKMKKKKEEDKEWDEDDLFGVTACMSYIVTSLNQLTGSDTNTSAPAAAVTLKSVSGGFSEQ